MVPFLLPHPSAFSQPLLICWNLGKGTVTEAEAGRGTGHRNPKLKGGMLVEIGTWAVQIDTVELSFFFFFLMNSVKALKSACHEVTGGSVRRGLSCRWQELSRSQQRQARGQWRLASHSSPWPGHQIFLISASSFPGNQGEENRIRSPPFKMCSAAIKRNSKRPHIWSIYFYPLIE